MPYKVVAANLPRETYMSPLPVCDICHLGFTTSFVKSTLYGTF